MKSRSLVVGVYPRFFIHRRNQDYLYHRSLRSMYERMGRDFEIIGDPLYCLRAVHSYLRARWLRGKGREDQARRIVASFERQGIPARHARRAEFVHTGGAIPPNCRGKIIREGEFYAFGDGCDRLLSTEQLECVRAFVVRTALSAEFFKRQYEPKYHARVRVVPFFMPYFERWESRRPRKPSPSGGLNFLFVGNQAKRKGLDLFLLLKDEMQELPRPKARFTVISNFQDGTDFDLTGCEVHRGVNGEHVQDLMEQAHYLVLPTRSDSHPKVMYEGCAAGCTLIHSDIRPLRDVWGDSGHEFRLVDPITSAKALAAKLAARAGDLEIGERNRARFLAEFAPSVAIRRYAELLD